VDPVLKDSVILAWDAHYDHLWHGCAGEGIRSSTVPTMTHLGTVAVIDRARDMQGLPGSAPSSFAATTGEEVGFDRDVRWYLEHPVSAGRDCCSMTSNNLEIEMDRAS
jgi:hypothetical protein